MNRNYWASIFYDGSADFTKTVQKYEDRGLAGLEVPQVYGSPFVPLAVAVVVTARAGTVIKTVGDAFLVDFPSVVHAVQCAQQIQHQFRTHNVEKAKDDRSTSALVSISVTSSNAMEMCLGMASISPRGCKHLL